MQAVLLRLRRVHLLEVDPRPDLLRINDCAGGVPLRFRHPPRLEELVPGCEARWRVLFFVVKSRCPQFCEPSRGCAVEDDLNGCSPRRPPRPPDESGKTLVGCGGLPKSPRPFFPAGGPAPGRDLYSLRR